MIRTATPNTMRRVYKNPRVLKNTISPKKVYIVFVIVLLYWAFEKAEENILGKKLKVKILDLEIA